MSNAEISVLVSGLSRANKRKLCKFLDLLEHGKDAEADKRLDALRKKLARHGNFSALWFTLDNLALIWYSICGNRWFRA